MTRRMKTRTRRRTARRSRRSRLKVSRTNQLKNVMMWGRCCFPANEDELVKLSKLCNLPPDILADMTPEERQDLAKKFAPGATPMVTIITKEQEEAERKAAEEAEKKVLGARHVKL